MTVDDITDLQPCSDMLDEEEFWGIVDKSLVYEKEEEQMNFLVKEVSRMSAQDMIGFRFRTEKLLNDIYTSDMWCAGYIMNGGCSDDGFEYFRRWVVSRGKEVYYNAKRDPDSLISQVSDQEADFYFEFESFGSVAYDAFREKLGASIFDYSDYKAFRAREGGQQNFTFTWSEDDPSTMKAICPQLYEKLYQ